VGKVTPDVEGVTVGVALGGGLALLLGVFVGVTVLEGVCV